MRNRYDIYDIIIENADDIVPNKVMDAMAQFAETIVLKNGETKMFKRGGLGRNRAKKFLTQVGLSGVYETFRLDTETFTIGMKAIGGAVSIDGYADTNTIRNSKFINNTAYVTGGALSFEGEELSIFESEFVNNTALDDCGAIFTYSNKATIIKSKFERNNAPEVGAV